ITNIVCCIPLEGADGFSSGTIRDPTKDEAAACKPRLLEVIGICKPRLIVCLGDVARRFLPDLTAFSPLPIQRLLPHPAKILRIERPAVQALAEKRFSLDLASYLELLHA